MYRRTKRRWVKHLDFILLDLLCIHIAFILSYGLWTLASIGRFAFVYNIAVYRELGVILTLIHFCFLFFTDSYSGILRRGFQKEFNSVVIHNFFLFVGIGAYLFLVKSASLVSRGSLFIFFGMSVLIMYVSRILLKLYIRHSGTNENNKRHFLFITDQPDISFIIENFRNQEYNTVLAGIVRLFCDSQENDEQAGVPVVADDVNKAYEFALQNVVDEVFIYMPGRGGTLTEALTDEFLQMGITVHVNLDMFSSSLPNVLVEKFGGCTVMTTSVNVVTPFEQFLKRLFDIIAGLLGSVFTCLLYIFLAPAIKIADPGPVFFSQERVGLNGRIFKIYKFRSMYQDAEERKLDLMDDNKMEGHMFKIDADPRIIGSGPDGTRKGLGHWIRAFSLDEFPNFFNILKGDMSFVGTRPPTVDEYNQYSLHHKGRLASKPGLTGLWQVSGRSNITDFEEIVKLDTDYIKNWSFGLDIKIILKTIVVVITRRGSV